MREGKNIQIIEWHDMDKKKFYSYGVLLGGSLRFAVYPMNLVKTRLQAQMGHTAYRGTFDAIKKIAQREGIRGFYKGFPVSLYGIIAGQFYITTFETSKQILFPHMNTVVQHLLGGFLASTVSQTIMVPVDIISQYQQVSGARTKPVMASVVVGDAHKRSHTKKQNKTYNFGQSYQISKTIVKREGLRGLYRGYMISLCTYGTNSSLYWGFYYLYSELIESFLPSQGGSLHEALRIGASGILGSSTAIILTNPLDVVRTRFQLQVKSKSGETTALETYKALIREEGYRGLTKGMVARILQSSVHSWMLILGYEYVKKISVKKRELN